MNALKSYYKQQSELSMFKLQHDKPPDFYLSKFQATRSVVPLLILRVLLLLASLIILLSSVITHIVCGKFQFWFIYLTHWGLCSVLLTTVFAVVVSTRVYLYGPISADFNLPWFMKTFWVLYNITTPGAFLITVFYWTILYSTDETVEEEGLALDVAVHGLNSIIMLALLLSSSVPSRILHIYQPGLFGIVYMLFGVFYYIGGGKDKFGNPYIYVVVDWANPGPTTLVVILAMVFLIFVHLLTVVLTLARDWISVRVIKTLETVPIEEGLPLRSGPKVDT